MRKIILIVALASSTVAMAASSLTSTLTWTAVTTNTDGTAATGVTYNVYAEYGAGGAYSKIATGLAVLTFVDSSTSLVDGLTACYEVSAVEGGVESTVSAPACKTFPPGIPNPPSGLVVN